MAIVKVSELQGAALDWAVAQAEGLDWQLERGCYGSGRRVVVLLPEPAHKRYGFFRPSTDWSHGGPLIEEYRISIECIGIGWIAEAQCRSPAGSLSPHVGDSVLEAACRSIVSAKLGDEIDVPDELIS